MPVYIEENNVDVNRPTDRANIEQSDFLKVKKQKKGRYLQLSCELLMTQVVNIVCSYVLPYHPFQLYKSPHPWQPQKSRRPPLLTPKQPKVAIFDKTDFLDLKYPPEVQVEPKTCSTIFRTPVPAILNHKNSTWSAGGARKGQNMAHIQYYMVNVLCSTRPHLWELLQALKVSFVKNSHFWLFLV